MFLEVRNRHTNKVLGHRYVCHGCGLLSRLMKRDYQPPVGWESRFESSWSVVYARISAFLRARQGQVENHYCRDCVRARCTARTVAQTELKAARQQKRQWVAARQQEKCHGP